MDFHFTPGQQMSRGTAVFDKSTNRISSPAGTSTAPCSTFSRVFPRFRDFFLFFLFPFPLFSFPSPLFHLLSNAHGRQRWREMEVIRLTKGRHEVNLNIFSPFRSISATISFHLIYERVYTSYFSNRYNKDRKTQSIILDRDK